MRFLPEYEIEAAAQDVLASYQKKHGLITERVPIDDIVEQHLGIHLESFDDTHLPDGFRNLVLGYIDLRNQSIGIHDSLFPEISGNEGRYNFTLAHEVGHYVMHQDEILAEEGQHGCFEQENTPRDLSPMEWQADCFAGHLLMPEIMVRRYWQKRTKSENGPTQEQIARCFNAKTREKCSPDVLVWLYIRRIADEMGSVINPIKAYGVDYR